MAEWSKLSFSSPELLAHAVGSRFKSCQWNMFLTSTFILSTQIISYPTLLPYIMAAQFPHLGKKCCTTKDDQSLMLYDIYYSMTNSNLYIPLPVARNLNVPVHVVRNLLIPLHVVQILYISLHANSIYSRACCAKYIHIFTCSCLCWSVHLAELG